MNSNWSPKVFVGFIIATLVIAFIGFSYLYTTRELINTSRKVQDVHNKIASVNLLITLLKDIERGQRGYLISSNETFLAPYREGLQELDREIQKLDILLKNDQEQRIKFNNLEILIDKKINHSKIAVGLFKDGRKDEAIAMISSGEGLEMMEKIIKDAKKIEQQENKKLSKGIISFHFSSSICLISIISGLIITFLVILVGVVKIVSEVKRRVHLETELQEKNRELLNKSNEIDGIAKKLKTANETIIEYADKAVGSQEDTFRSVLYNIPYPLLIFTKDKRLEFINNEAINNFEIINHDLINKKSEEIFSSTKAMHLDGYISRVLAHKKKEKAEIVQVVNQKELFFTSIFIPILDETGEVGKILITALDITEKVENEKHIYQLNEESEVRMNKKIEDLEKANQELIEQFNETKDFYNNAPIGYYSIDNNGNFVKINDTGLELLGYNREEILNRNILAIIPEKEQRLFRKSFTDFTEKGIVKNIEGLFVRKDGSEMPVIINAVAVFDKENNFVMSRSAFIDNTELKRAKTEIEKYIEALQSANKELESFSYSVSHDLRTPLRSINGFSNILKNDYFDALDEEGKRYLDIILYNTKQMSKLIDDLLEFCRLGRKGMSKTYFSMEELVCNVFKEIIVQDDGREKIKFSHDPLPFVSGDRSLLKQVWANLISNAIKFSSKKNTSIVSITYKEDVDDYIFYIKDNGVGFDTRFSNKLFAVFQRLHTYEEFEGTGVGLAIVHRIIASHGGKVGAESQLGEGATFYFTLPKSL